MASQVPVAASLAVLSALAVDAQAATPADAAAAQALFDQGRKLMATGKEKDACPKFEESQRLDPGTGTEFHLADCYERVGRAASAWTLFLEVASESRAANQSDREQLARKRAEALVTQLSKLVIDVPEDHRAPGMTVQRSGASVGAPQWGQPMPVDAGEQSVRVEAPGFEAWTGKVMVPAGATASIQVPALQPLPASAAPMVATPMAESSIEDAGATPRTSTLRYVAYGLGAGGVVGVGIGSLFGIKAISAKGDAGCNGSDCPNDHAASKYRDAQSAGNVATVGFIAGGVLLGAGVVLYLVSSPKASDAPRVSLAASLDARASSISLRGLF